MTEVKFEHDALLLSEIYYKVNRLNATNDRDGNSVLRRRIKNDILSLVVGNLLPWTRRWRRRGANT